MKLSTVENFTEPDDRSFSVIPLTDESKLIADDPIPHFISWAEYEFFQSRGLTKVQKGARIIGFIVGPLSVVFAIPYGYDFATKNLPFIPSEAAHGLGIYFAVVGTLALGALVGRVTSQTWPAMLKPKNPHLFEISNTSWLKNIAFFIPTVLAGAMAMTPTLLLTHEFLAPISLWLAVPADIITFVGYLTLRTWAIQNLLINIGNTIKFEFYQRTKALNDIRNVRARLRKTLMQSKIVIGNLSDNQLTFLHNNIRNIDMRTMNKIEYLFDPENLPDIGVLNRSPKPILKSIIQIGGGIIGLTYPYSSYVLAQRSSNIFWQFLGIENTTALYVLGQFFGVSSYVCVGSLGAIANSETFGMAYDALGRCCRRKTQIAQALSIKDIFSIILSIFFIFIALTSAVPRTSISLTYSPDFWIAYVLAAFTALSTFANDFWALDGMKNELMYQKTKKQELTTMVDGLIKTVPNAKKELIPKLIGLSAIEERNRFFAKSAEQKPSSTEHQSYQKMDLTIV